MDNLFLASYYFMFENSDEKTSSHRIIIASSYEEAIIKARKEWEVNISSSRMMLDEIEVSEAVK